MAARLHMGVEQLRALEEGDGEALPEPVFVVAQARRVAASLGLNIDADVAALRSGQTRSARPAPVPRREPAVVPPAAAAPGGVGLPLTALRAIAAAAALGLGSAALWGVVQNWGRQAQPQAPARTPAPATTRPPVAARPPELRLQASEPSWLEVRRSDDTVLFRGTFRGERRFPLTGELQVLAGRPDLVTVSVNGAAPTPLGTIESVRWSRFSQARPSAPAP